jgi:hypothetical protein
MTAAQFSDFIAEVRVECDARLALLAATDPATLPAELRDAYDQVGNGVDGDARTY